MSPFGCSDRDSWEKFPDDQRDRLKEVLGARIANAMMPELEWRVRVYRSFGLSEPLHRREHKEHFIELARLVKKVTELRAALAGATPSTKHHNPVAETIAMLDGLTESMQSLLSLYGPPKKQRPEDKAWKGVCCATAELLAREKSLKITTAEPLGHRPRGGKLWGVLDILSEEARGRPVQKRDVQEAARFALARRRANFIPPLGTVVSQKALAEARALRAAAK